MSLLPNIVYANPNTPLWASATSGGGSNVSNGNISSLFGYDQYTIYSSTFNDDNIQFNLANNYVEQQFLSDGSNYGRITSDTDGLLLESFYLSSINQGPRNISLQTFDNLNGVVLKAGIDTLTSSFLVSTTNGIISQTGTISSLNLTALDIDGQILTADPTTLFLNGVPLATEASISSLSQWALDPALSTIQGNNNDLVDVRAGLFSSITANGIQTNTLTAISTIQTFNYLSTNLVNSDLVSTAAIVASTFNGFTVSDFLSTSPSQYNPNPVFSTIVSQFFISSLDLEISSINGHEFNQNTVIISTVNTDLLNAVQISSLTGDITLQLVSTLSFKPEFKVDFNFDLSPIGEGIKSGLTRVGIGIAAGLGAVGTGIAAAVYGRSQTTNIYNNSSNFEMINGTTQLQFSTFNYDVSSIYRFVSSSGEPDLVPGQEIFVSSIIPAGTSCVRSFSDPVNLLDPSTFTSTIQSFGQWVALPEAPAVSTVSTFVDLTTESLFASTIQIGPSTILTSEPNIPGLSIRQADDFSVSQLNCSAVAIGDINSTFQGAYIYAPAFDRASVLNSSLQTKYVAYLDDLQNIQNNSVSTFELNVSSINSQPYQPFSGGQYYRTSNQNLPTGNNFLIFNASKPWTSADFVQSDPSTFLCSTSGTYQLGVNLTVAKATGTSLILNKSLFINQDRGGSQSVVAQSTSIPSAQDYAISLSAVLDINQGDTLRFITGQNLNAGSTISLGLLNTFDYNTFWDYQLLRKD